MKKREIPLLEYDGTVPAVLEPSQTIAPMDVPEQCVLTFFQDVIDAYKEAGQLKEIFRTGSEIGPNPLYEMDFNGKRLAVMHAGVGAPLSAAYLEELIAVGCRKFIACGGCGVLDEGVGLGHVIVPIDDLSGEEWDHRDWQNQTSTREKLFILAAEACLLL